MTDTTDPQTARFRHRIPEVEAVQWTGSNADALRAFCGPDFDTIDPEDRIEDPDQTAAVREADHGTWRGLAPGDWVVRLDGGLYEFSAADFAKQYEPAAPSTPADRAGLCDLIRRAVCEAEGFAWDSDMLEPDEYGDVADMVLSVLPADSEPHRLALSEALGLGASAPWDAIRERGAEIAGQGVAGGRDADRRLYAWAHAVGTDEGDALIPGVHSSGTGVEEIAVVVHREDIPVLAAMLAEEGGAPVDRAAVFGGVRPQTLTAIASHLDARAVAILRPGSETYAGWQTVVAELRRMAGEEQQPSPRCTCGETACESELCDCDSVPCPVDHADEEQQAETQAEFTEARAAFMQIGRTPSLEGLRTELRIEGWPPIVGSYNGAAMGRMHDVPGCEHLLSIEPRLIFEYADEQPAVVAEPGKETRPAIPCSWAATRYQHSPHAWNPQPGMDPVRCPGWSDGESTP